MQIHNLVEKLQISQFKMTFLKKTNIYFTWYYSKIKFYVDPEQLRNSHSTPTLSLILSLILYTAQKLASANIPAFAQEG